MSSELVPESFWCGELQLELHHLNFHLVQDHPINTIASTQPEKYEVKNKINVKAHIRMAACHTSKAGFETKCSD